MNAASAIAKAVHATLVSDATLAGLLGADRVFDEPPPGLTPPFAVFGPASVAPYPGGGEAQEHFIEIGFWSGGRGRKEVSALYDAARRAMQAPAAAEAPFVLSNLEFVSGRIARDPATRWFRADLRFRAVTETV